MQIDGKKYLFDNIAWFFICYIYFLLTQILIWNNTCMVLTDSPTLQ